jgi:hypothetical protein
VNNEGASAASRISKGRNARSLNFQLYLSGSKYDPKGFFRKNHHVAGFAGLFIFSDLFSPAQFPPAPLEVKSHVQIFGNKKARPMPGFKNCAEIRK